MVNCSICKKKMKRVLEVKDVPVITLEFYLNPDLLKKNFVYYCDNCKIITTLGFFESIRFRIARKIYGDIEDG